MIRIVLFIFGKAVTDKKHRASLNGESTFSAEELAHAVKQLSRNNANSRELVKNGALGILSQGLKFESEAERKVFMESLWWLSFVEENRAEMVQDQELLDRTIAIYHDKDKYPQCHEAAEGMLFQLVEKLQTLDNKKYGPLVEQLKGQKTQTLSKSGHVMLSYNRENRPVVTKICDFLKNNGISSWMDIYNMPEAEGSTTQMMAEAVENAVIFLMCVSEGYKNSQYCRQEAEYANRRRKMIVPLQMQARYDPDGWLGFIMGNDYFLDFSREELHQDKLGKLLVKVKKAFAGTQDSVDGPVIPVKSTPTKAAPTTPVIDHSHGGMVFSAPPPAAESHRLPSAALDQIRNWTHEDIKRWQQKFDISGKNVMSLNGKELAFLRVMKTEAPDFFYQMLVTQLQLKSVSAMANFTYGLEEIHTMLN